VHDNPEAVIPFLRHAAPVAAVSFLAPAGRMRTGWAVPCLF
jgi:hypothetical protein